MKRFLFLLIASFSCALAAPRVANLAIVCDPETKCWSMQGEQFTSMFISSIFAAKSTPIILTNTLARRVLSLMLTNQLTPIVDEAQAQIVLNALRTQNFGCIVDDGDQKAPLPLDHSAYARATGLPYPSRCYPQWWCLESAPDLPTAIKTLNLFRFIEDRIVPFKMDENVRYYEFMPDDVAINEKLNRGRFRDLIKHTALFDPEQWQIYCPHGNPCVVLFLPAQSATDAIGLQTDNPDCLRHYATDELPTLLQHLTDHAKEQGHDMVIQIANMLKPQDPTSPLIWNLLFTGHGSQIPKTAGTSNIAQGPQGTGTPKLLLAGMPESTFVQLVTHFVTNVDCAAIAWISCYGGGERAQKIAQIMQEAARNAGKRIPIALSTLYDGALTFKPETNFKPFFDYLAFKAVLPQPVTTYDHIPLKIYNWAGTWPVNLYVIDPST